MQFRKETKTRIIIKKKLKTVSEKCRTPLITPIYALNYNTRRRIEREWSRKTYLKNIDRKLPKFEEKYSHTLPRSLTKLK